MSRFSDKSDFSDTCLMHYTPDKIAYAKISVDGIPLKVNSPRDLIPYYGNLISSMSSSSDNISINLIKTSQPRLREIDTINIFISEYVSKCRKAKRNKTTLTFEDFKDLSRDNVVNFIMYERCEEHKDLLLKVYTPYAHYSNKKAYYEIINREIIETLFSDIHTSIGTFYRKNLLEHAADFWGNQLKLSKEDYIVWSQSNKLDYENFCPALLKIQQEVWEYDKAIKRASEELELC